MSEKKEIEDNRKESKIPRGLANPTRPNVIFCFICYGKKANIQIGVLLGLTHSAVSRSVAITRKKWRWSKISKGR